MHAALVAVHATAAVASLVAAVLLLIPRPLPQPVLHPLAVAAAVATSVMALSLGAAVAVGWDQQPLAANVVFGALVVLALVAAVCAGRAVRVSRRRTDVELGRLYDAGGFVLITQLTGFVAIAVLDVLPTWGVVSASVVTVLVARSLVGRMRAAARRGGSRSTPLVVQGTAGR